MQKSRHDLIIISLLLLSVTIRWLLISKGPYHTDCLSLAINARETLLNHKLYYQFGPGYLLTVFLGAVFVWGAKFFSVTDPVIAVNFMAVIFSSLCIPVFYFLTRKLFDEITALTGAMIFSVSPIFLGVSVYGNSHAISLFFLLTGILFLLKYRESPLRKYFFLSAIAVGLMGAARLQDMAFMLLPVSYLFFADFQKNKSQEAAGGGLAIKKCFQYWLLAFLTVAVVYIPFFLQQNLGEFGQQFGRFWQIGLAHNFRGIVSKSLHFSFLYFAMNFSPLGLLAILLGSYFLYKQKPRIFILLFLWFIIPFSFYGNLYTSVPRFLVFILPPLIMTVGYLFSYLSSRGHLARLISLGAFVILISSQFTYIYPILQFRHDYALLPGLGRWVGQQTEENARIINADEGIFVHYYGRREELKRPADMFDMSEKGLMDFKKTLDQILGQGIPVYITSPGLYDYDPDERFSEFIKKHYRLKSIGKCLSEDWHRGELVLWVQWIRLYKISQKD